MTPTSSSPSSNHSATPPSMNKGGVSRSAPGGQLTVLIFKDNFSARTFRVPLKWIAQFGWLLGALLVTAVLSMGFAVKLMIASVNVTNLTPRFLQPESPDAARVKQLEKELIEARSQIQTLSSSSTPTQNSTAPASVTTEPSSLPVVDPALLSASAPIRSRPFLFKGLPDQIQPLPADAKGIPITLVSPQANWDGKMLKVRFALQYVSDKAGGQQGRILILARGPGTLMTHPNRLMQGVDQETLIDPNQGEYFSVSRFREAKAEFGPFASRDLLKEVEIIILSATGQMLIHQKILPGDSHSVPHKSSASEPATSAPKESSQP